MIYKILHISMYHLMILSGIIAFVMPTFFQLLSDKLTQKNKVILLYMYIIGMLFVTLFLKGVHNERMMKLTPFWSYAKFDQADIRWQVYMNVFLFMPFGFFIPFSCKKSFFQTLMIGLCLSITIEAMQYIFALGLCETDDVIHNTVGTAIGYLHWCVLNKVSDRKRKFTK